MKFAAFILTFAIAFVLFGTVESYAQTKETKAEKKEAKKLEKLEKKEGKKKSGAEESKKMMPPPPPAPSPEPEMDQMKTRGTGDPVPGLEIYIEEEPFVEPTTPPKGGKNDQDFFSDLLFDNIAYIKPENNL